MPKQPPAPEEPQTEGRLSPREHALATGNVREMKSAIRFGNDPFALELYSWQHNAAAALHGWKAHEHHSGEPLRLTREEYLAALKAAEAPVTRVIEKDGKAGKVITQAELVDLKHSVPTRTDYEPHEKAKSPFLGAEV